MTREVVLDCRMLQNTDYDVQSVSYDGKTETRAISDLYSPPLPKTKQLEKDFNRDGIVLNLNGTITLCQTLAEFESLESIPSHIKNYILRVGHQGLFGGQASSTGPGNIARDSSNKSLIQDSLPSDAPLVLTIEEDKKITLVQTTNYSYTEFMDTDKLANLQLSLVADLTNLPKDLDKTTPLTLNMPMYLVALGDDTIINAIHSPGAKNAVVEKKAAESITNMVSQARGSKLLAIHATMAEKVASADLVGANYIFDSLESTGTQIPLEQIKSILMNTQGILESTKEQFGNKEEFLTKIFGYISSLPQKTQHEIIPSLETALGNIEKSPAFRKEHDMLYKTIKANLPNIEISHLKPESKLQSLGRTLSGIRARMRSISTPSPISSADSNSIEPSSPPRSPPNFVGRSRPNSHNDGGRS